ncbi:MAG: TonB-dependent receptor, partial [Proteobacteria bacterium]|nr:TonB-dependent receptor [Pseudomonadota bacterium]
LEHDFNDSVTFRNQFRYASYGRSGRITEPQVVYAGITPITALSAINVNRNMIAVTSTETFLQNQSDVIVRFNTGPIDHSLVAGLELGRETSSPIRTTYSNVPRTNLVFPVPSPFVAPSRISTNINTTSTMYSAYIMDTIKLGEQWELTGGFRFDSFNTNYAQTVAPSVFLSQTDNMPSYRTALVYKPRPNGSVYFAYGTSFNPSAEGLSIATSNAGLDPEENVSYELGTKWDVLNNALTLSGSIFQISKLNARVPDPYNSAFNILGGNQRVRGFEIGAVGRITDRWEIYYGYSFLESRVTASTLPATVGQQLANTPQNTLSLWNTYTFPWRDIQIGGGLQWVSSRIASSTPSSSTGLIETAPGYFTLQAMAKYPVSPGFDLQLNIFNISNTKYYDLLHPNHVVPGAATSALLTATFRL